MTKEYALLALRSAAMYGRRLANDADMIGTALKTDVVTPDAALLWARDVGVLEFVAQDEIESAVQEMEMAS